MFMLIWCFDRNCFSVWWAKCMTALNKKGNHIAVTSHYVRVFQITGNSTVCSTVISGTHQRKHQSSAWLAIVRGIHWWLMDSPHRWILFRNASSWINRIESSWNPYLTVWRFIRSGGRTHYIMQRGSRWSTCLKRLPKRIGEYFCCSTFALMFSLINLFCGMTWL